MTDNSIPQEKNPVIRYGSKVAIILYLSGIAGFALLISEDMSDRTYFSDNALLPGLVNREFTLGSRAESILKLLEGETSSGLGQMPVKFIKSQFASLGLEVYSQNFSLHYPFGKKEVFFGENVYAVLRAPRAPSQEAMVLSAPFRAPTSPHGSTLPSIALMLSLAKYFSSKSYWAKDIIFLIADHELVGFQAWLNAYHNMPSSNILNYAFLTGSSGPIQAALNLELKSSSMTRLEIKIEGLNGQLPNLDLFNVVVELATRESVTATFHGASHPYASSGPLESWMSYAKTIGSMMTAQASSLPTGAHGLFQKFQIQSLTLEGVERKDRNFVPVSLLQVGRTVEGIIRSVNNLLERFNRSYWFYLLPSTRRYVSIGYYMIPFGLMTSPLLIIALKYYLQMGALKIQWVEEGLPFTFAAHALGLLLVSFPYLQGQYEHYLGWDNYPPENVLYTAILTFCAFNLLNPLFISSRSDATKIICLLNAALVLSCISLFNISLALFLSLIHTPILCFIGSISSRWKLLKRIVDITFLVLIHPITIHFLCLLVFSFLQDPSNKDITRHITRAVSGQRRQILYFVEDWLLFGNWTFVLASAFLLPIWLQAFLTV